MFIIKMFTVENEGVVEQEGKLKDISSNPGKITVSDTSSDPIDQIVPKIELKRNMNEDLNIVKANVKSFLSASFCFNPKYSLRFSLNNERQDILSEFSWIFSFLPEKLQTSLEQTQAYEFLKQDQDFDWSNSYIGLKEELKFKQHPDKLARLIVDQLLMHSVRLKECLLLLC